MSHITIAAAQAAAAYPPAEEVVAMLSRTSSQRRISRVPVPIYIPEADTLQLIGELPTPPPTPPRRDSGSSIYSQQSVDGPVLVRPDTPRPMKKTFGQKLRLAWAHVITVALGRLRQPAIS